MTSKEIWIRISKRIVWRMVMFGFMWAALLFPTTYTAFFGWVFYTMNGVIGIIGIIYVAIAAVDPTFEGLIKDAKQDDTGYQISWPVQILNFTTLVAMLVTGAYADSLGHPAWAVMCGLAVILYMLMPGYNKKVHKLSQKMMLQNLAADHSDRST